MTGTVLNMRSAALFRLRLDSGSPSISPALPTLSTPARSSGGVLYRTLLFVSGISPSILRLSNRDWTRLHVRAHSCLVIWVPESHICMQSATALSCSFSRDCGSDCLWGDITTVDVVRGSIRRVVKEAGLAGGGIVCADAAAAPSHKNTMEMTSKRMGRPSRTRKEAVAQLRGGSGPPKIGAMSTFKQTSCCPGASGHGRSEPPRFGKYLLSPRASVRRRHFFLPRKPSLPCAQRRSPRQRDAAINPTMSAISAVVSPVRVFPRNPQPRRHLPALACCRAPLPLLFFVVVSAAECSPILAP